MSDPDETLGPLATPLAPLSTFNPSPTHMPSLGIGDIKGLVSQALSDLATIFELEVLVQTPNSASNPVFEFPVFKNLVGDGEVNADVAATLSLDSSGGKLIGG